MVNAEPTKRRHYAVTDGATTWYDEATTDGQYSNYIVLNATFIEERDEWHFSEQEKSKLSSKIAGLNEQLSGASKRWQNNR